MWLLNYRHFCYVCRIYAADEAFRIKTAKKNDEVKFPRDIAYQKGLDYDFYAPPTSDNKWEVDDLPKLFPKLCIKFT